MIKYLVNHGNSSALVIDKSIMELLHIDMDTPLEISTDGKILFITPTKATARQKLVRAAYKRVVAKHRKTFARLAKS